MRISTRLSMLFLLLPTIVLATTGEEDKDAYRDIADKIIDTSLQEGQAYHMLRELCLKIGPRLSGSPQAAAAVDWGRDTMERLGLDNVHLQPVMVPHWVRGDVETASVVNSGMVGTRELTVCALGGSIATPELGITGRVIEVQSLEEAAKLGARAKGAILFYNRAFDKTHRRTFTAYGGAVDQRSRGAIEASKVGAVAVLVRSMTARLDDVPHTGAMHYEEGTTRIPAAALSTLDANFLSSLLKTEEDVHVNLKLNCQTLPDVLSANVVGEITGSEMPDEVVLLGGHLDSWDKGHGAHDDGTGCVQSIEALRLLKALDLKPKRTIRAVLFMNEENGLRGGRAYAKKVAEEGPKHIAALEGDSGGFTPRGISVKTTPDSEVLKRVSRWAYLFASIHADKIQAGFGGADISPLEPLGTLTMGLVVDSHRYFDYHHSDNDTFDKVNEREVELGAATMAIMAYVLANEGLE